PAITLRCLAEEIALSHQLPRDGAILHLGLPPRPKRGWQSELADQMVRYRPSEHRLKIVQTTGYIRFGSSANDQPEGISLPGQMHLNLPQRGVGLTSARTERVSGRIHAWET